MSSVPPLPVELLRLVVDNFKLPPYSDPRRTIARERVTHEILCSLCLTSRVFRQIAQPRIFQIVHCRAATFSKLVRNNRHTGLLTCVKCLVLDEIFLMGETVDNEKGWIDEVVEQFAKGATELQTLIVSPGWTNLNMFDLSALKTMCLSEVVLDELFQDVFPEFPSLETLSLSNVEHPVAQFDWSPFRSLRHFAWEEDPIPEVEGVVFGPIPARIDSLHVMADVLCDRFEQYPALCFDRILVSTIGPIQSVFNTIETYVKHLRLLAENPTFMDLNERPCRLLDDVCALLLDPAKLTNLETIYLPPPPPNLLRDTLRAKELAKSTADLVIACRTRQIEVVIEEQPRAYKAENVISPEFARRRTQIRFGSEGGRT